MISSLPADAAAALPSDSDAVDEDVFVFPASFAQQRLWFLDQLEPGTPLYNIPTAVRLTGALDATALQRAIDEVVQRHETLRTTFAAIDGQPMQVIAPAGTQIMPLPMIDLRDLSPAERMGAAQELAGMEARRPFDLARGPLLRATLLRLDGQDHVVLLTMHHIISDGWSIGVLVGEIAALYHAFAHGRPAPLPELPIQYADFAEWQREWLQGEVLEAQLAYWKARLAGSPPLLALPTDRPRSSAQTTRGGSRSLKLPYDLSRRLNAISREAGATLFMTLLAAFQTLLYRYSGQDDVCIGSPIANRNRAEIESLIGFFVNTLVLRSDLSGTPAFRTLLARVREVTLGAYDHQDLPFEMVVEAVQPARDLSITPLFQVMFILQNAGAKVQELPGLTLRPLDVHSGTSTFDLTLSMAEDADGLDAAMEYSADLFDDTTIGRMLEHFKVLLAGIAAEPDRPIATLPLLTQAEREQVLVEWNTTVQERLEIRDWRLSDTETPISNLQSLISTGYCVHDLFAAQAERTPDAVAVVWGAERMRYGELNARANQLAHYLRGCGVGPEVVVAVCAERSAEMIVALLGVLKAGGAYLPLDQNYPQERLAFMLANSRASVLITYQEPRTKNQEPNTQEQRTENKEQNGQEPRTKNQELSGDNSGSRFSVLGSEGRVIDLSRDWPLIAQQPTGNPNHASHPDHLAYMIYTSGSTGQSKGVMIAHRNLLNAYQGWEQSYGLRDEARVHLQMASFSFDVFSGDLVRALCSGGTLVLCPRDLLLAPDQLYDLMRREQVDCAEFVPVVLRGLAAHLEQRGGRLDFMRLLICGSDTWYVREYEQFRRLCGPRTRLVNSFGLTEATIDSTFFEHTGLSLAGDQLVPIGRPFAGSRLYILDNHMQPTPIGVPGELYVGGAGVARGYFDRPDLTAERFVPNPFADQRLEIRDWRLSDTESSISNLQSLISMGTRLYKTGDRARYLSDGNVEFLGRVDHQVKIRGFRIEPGEIAAALAQHPAVGTAVVLAREAGPGDTRLVAYLTQEPRTKNQEPTAGDSGSRSGTLWVVLGSGELRGFLADRLPDYMLPSAFVVLDELPVTPNGKIDTQTLPAPDWSARALGDAYVAPRTPDEEALAGIWAQVLGVERVGVHDHFFALGGHSLLATQLISRLRETLRVELPLRAVFEAPTIAAMAGQIVQARRAAGAVQTPPIGPAARNPDAGRGDADLPLSFAQQRLWFLDQLEPGSPFYNIPEAVRLTGPLDVHSLRRGLAEIVRRHEALRTTFATVDGRPRQVIAPAGTGVQLSAPTLPVVDLRALPAEARGVAARRLAMEEARQPFDLARGPLLRARLLQLDGQDHIVLLTLHHIISDDWSTNVLIQEISALYDAFTHGRPSPLPELPLQYADYAAWQRGWLQGAVLKQQLDYWTGQLRGAPPLLELPTDRPRPAVQSFEGAYQTFRLPAGLSAQLKDLTQAEGATLFMTLLAAFQTLLARYSGQADISIGTPIAGRNRAEIENLIGFFVNTLVLRADLNGEPGFRALLAQVRAACLGAYAHQDLPFEMIVDALQPERNLSHTPLFQVMFAVQNAPLRAQELASLLLGAVEAHSGTAKFDLTLFMIEEGGQIGGAFEYNTDLFDEATIARMARHFQTLLAGIVTDPEQSIAALPLLSEAERDQLLVEWSGALAEPRTKNRELDACIHELFAAQAAATPNVIAAIDGRERLSYAELNARANQLAHYLQRQGAGPDSLVGVCMPRSCALMVALLGILKAGAAYLPLDPNYPPARLAFMLKDSHARLLISQEIRDWRLEINGSDQSLISNLQSPTIINLDAEWSAIAQEPISNPEQTAHPDHLAYVIYTSGSTGTPKGVMIAHRGLSNYLAWASEAYAVAEGQGAPVHSSIAFDLTITGLFAPLLAGRPVELLPDEQGVETLGASLRERPDFSLVKLTPAHLELLAAQLAPEQAAGGARAFVIGGEPLLAERVAFWRQHAPQTLLINEYGPTETVVGCCVYTVTPDTPTSGAIPIGRPIANTQLYVLDRRMQPQPIGVVGELYIGGVQLARGYLGRPDLTAERFIPNPFPTTDSPDKVTRRQGDKVIEIAQEVTLSPVHPVTVSGVGGGRLYKTGDLARWRADGELEFLGRRDDQVKLRGFRIELGEIEAALRQYPAVREASVIVREDAPGVRRLVAYLTPTTDDPRDKVTRRQGDKVTEYGEEITLSPLHPVTVSGPEVADELRMFLKERLPEYMVPTAFVLLDELPLTTNGKVDRQALPAPDGARPELGTQYAAPDTPEQVILAGVWAQVLGVEQVGIHDNFFALGGDSILAIQVIARADQAGLHLTPRQLFQHPTVAGLGAVAESTGAAHAGQGVQEGPVPLTPIQRRLLEQDGGETGRASEALLLQARLPLERGALVKAVAALLEQHDALRLRLNPAVNGWEQAPAGPVPLEWIDLADSRPAEHTSVIETTTAQSYTRLDPVHGPLLHMVYFDPGISQPGQLLVIIHRLVIDALSWRVLLEDMHTAYSQAAAGVPVRLPPRTAPFLHWAGSLHAQARSGALDAEQDYWRTVLEGANPHLPVDAPAGANTKDSAYMIAIALDADETRALIEETPAAYRTTTEDVLLTALAQALSRWTGTPSALIDLEWPGRAAADMDLSRTVGCFTTLFPVRLDVDADDEPRVVLPAVKEYLRQIPNHGAGYGLLRYSDRVAVTEDSASSSFLEILPRPEVRFSYATETLEPPTEAAFDLAPGRGVQLNAPSATRRAHLLEVRAGIAGGQLRIEWIYSANVHRPATIQRVAQDFVAILRTLIEHCRSSDTSGYTASDFAEFDWSPDDLEDIRGEIAKSGLEP